MDRVRCVTCGEEHDLNEIEPSFDRPDAYFDVPIADRARRTFNEPALCVLWEISDQPRRHFLRVVLPIPIRGESRNYCWGVWVEVAEQHFALAHDHAADLEQGSLPPFLGSLANTLPDMPETLGLSGQVHLIGPGVFPEFHLAASTNHPLAQEQAEGVQIERVLEWAARAAHS